MLRQYRSLHDVINYASISAGDDDGVGSHAVDTVTSLFGEWEREFVYFARRWDPEQNPDEHADGKIVYAKKQTKADLQDLKTNTASEVSKRGLVNEAIKMSEILKLNEMTCASLIVEAEDELQDSDVRNCTPLFKGVYAYHLAMKHLLNAMNFLLMNCAGRGLPPSDKAQLRTFATTFITEQEYLTHDLLTLAKHDPKVNATQQHRTSIARVELAYLEINSVFASPKEKEMMEGVLLQQQQALANCIFESANLRFLVPASPMMPRIEEQEVLAMLRILIEHTKDTATPNQELETMDSLSAALFVGIIRILNISKDELPADSNDEHPLFLPREGASPANTVLDLIKSGIHNNAGSLKAPLQFIWGLLTSSDELIKTSLGLSAAHTEYQNGGNNSVSFKSTGTFTYLRTTLLDAPQFKRGHQYFRPFMNVVHEMMSRFVDDTLQWGSVLDDMRKLGVDAAEYSVSSNYSELFEFAGQFYGTMNLSDAWSTWANFVEDSSSLIFGLHVPFRNMLTGLAGPDETDAVPDDFYVDPAQQSAKNAEMVSAFLSNAARSEDMTWKNLFQALGVYSRQLSELHASKRRAIEDMQSGQPYDQAALNRRHILDIPQQPALVQLTSFVRLLRRVMGNTRTLCPPEETMAAIFALVCSTVQPTLKAELLGIMESYCNVVDGSSAWVRIQSLFSPDGQTNLTAEIDDVESSNREYPFTIALLSLLRTLIPYMPQLGPEGYQNYLKFIRSVIFSKYTGRGYRIPGEKWLIAREVLRIYITLLDSYTPHERDFVLVPVQNGPPRYGVEFLSGQERGGYDVIMSILGETPSTSLETLFEIIAQGSRDDPARHGTHATAFNETVKYALYIVVELLRKQSLFVKFGKIQRGMDSFLLEVDRDESVCKHILDVAEYLWTSTGANDVELPLYAIKIIFHLSKSIAAQPQLVVIFRSSPTKAHLLVQACTRYLGSDLSTPKICYDVYDNECVGPGAAISHSIVHLILLNLTKPVKRSVNLAHMLLGFDLEVSTLQEISASVLGKKRSNRSCLQKILELLQSTRPRLSTVDPILCELFYKLIYKMCFISFTSRPTLQYLSSQKFFVGQLKLLEPLEKREVDSPEQPDRRYCALMNCQGWFLKTIALEIHVSSNSQRRANPELLKLLFERKGLAVGSTSDPQMCMLKLLQPAELTKLQPEVGISHERGDDFRQRVNELYARCIIKREDIEGLLWCDVAELLAELQSELQADGQLGVPAKDEEIEAIVQAATDDNMLRQSIYAKRNFFDGWRRVIGVTLVQCPSFQPAAALTQAISDLLKELFGKLDSTELVPDLVEPISDAVIILMANLRQQLGELRHHDKSDASTADPYADSVGGSSGELSDTTLRQLLTGIKNGINNSDLNAKARQNMYGALLFYLQMVSDNHDVDRAFTDRVMEMVCRDASDGQGIRSSLSLAAIDSMIALDAHNGNNRWLSFLQRRGFLNHFVNEILERDAELIKQLAHSPQSFLPLHLHLSKMAFLNRLALSAIGAAGLAQAEVLWRLKDCRFVSARPTDVQGTIANAEASSPADRHREMVFPVLQLAISMLESGTGIQRKEIMEQVLHFVSAHAESYFKIVLRAPLQDWHTITSPSALEELNFVTALIRLVSGPEDAALTESVLAHHTVRLQTLMVSLLGFFSERKTWLLRMDYANYTKVEQLIIDKDLLHAEANIIGYIRGIMSAPALAESKSGSANTRVLLRPSFQADSESAHRSFPAGTPSLGVTVRMLASTFEFYKSKREAVRKCQDDLEMAAELVPTGKQKMMLELEQQTEIQDLSVYVLENTLEVLWRHLDFFFNTSTNSSKAGVLGTNDLSAHLPMGMSSKMGDRDIEALKREFLGVKELGSQQDSLLNMLASEEKERLKDDPMPRTTIQPLVRRIHDFRRSFGPM